MERFTEVLKYVESLLDLNHISYAIIEPPYKNFSMIDKEIKTIVYGLKNLPERVEDYLDNLKHGTLYFTSDVFQCNYTAIKFPDSDKIFVCGPIIYEKVSNKTFEKLFEHLEMDEIYRNTLYHFYTNITFFPSKGAIETTMIAFGNYLYNDSLKIVHEDMSSLEHYHRIYQDIFRIQDNPFSNLELLEKRYEMENAFLHEIALGNEKNAFEWLDRIQKASAIGLRHMDNEFRNIQDYLLTLNTLVRKKVETAGVHLIYIDALSNDIVKKIEKCKTEEQCTDVMIYLIRAYIELVKQTNLNAYPPIIQKMLAYINTDLKEDLSLKNFAEHLNVNASYLSTLFSKEVGVNLSDYVNQKRVEHAKKLLSGSDIPIKSVAEECGFQDTHYFCRVFKKISGETPKAYRDKNFIKLYKKA